ncbi:MAG: rRNA (guanine527-N7)-methyltransferase, partial [Methylobacteriaceae bacterium]|nr:rRNA (guanine527-N7)-methyltransferase [Methylobacteriaceae bacterium]
RSEIAADLVAKNCKAALTRIPLTRAEQKRLKIYEALLIRWQGMLNLVSTASLPQLWTRHIIDSAQLRDIAPRAIRWADLGSGGGFPGMVIAILLAETPGAEVHLIERDKRKAAFLQTVSRETGAAAIVHPARIEAIVPGLQQIEIVTSRALAPLTQLIDWSMPLFQRGATGLFLKGRTVQEEIATASDPKLDLSTLPSRTDSSGRIVSVRYKAK